MMRKKVSKALAASLAVCALSFSVARAMPLTLVNEYEVMSSAVNVGPATWQFTYEITNIDQGVPGYPYGLDGFAIQVPDSATLMGVDCPRSICAGIHRLLDHCPWSRRVPSFAWRGRSRLPLDTLVGGEPPSVYPPGSTTTLSVTLSNVSVSTNAGGLVTFWGGYVPPIEYYTLPTGANYTPYVTELVSPIAAVPAPARCCSQARVWA